MNVEIEDKLQKFIEGLLEEKMSEAQIKIEMEALGMRYTQDPLDRLNVLLHKLHPQTAAPRHMTDSATSVRKRDYREKI